MRYCLLYMLACCCLQADGSLRDIPYFQALLGAWKTNSEVMSEGKLLFRATMEGTAYYDKEEDAVIVNAVGQLPGEPPSKIRWKYFRKEDGLAADYDYSGVVEMYEQYPVTLIEEGNGIAITFQDKSASYQSKSVYKNGKIYTKERVTELGSTVEVISVSERATTPNHQSPGNESAH